MTSPRVLHVREVAAVFGVAELTVREWLRRGTLPGVRLGGRWYVRESSLVGALDRLEHERADVENHAARTLRGIREAKPSRRLVVPPRPPSCAPSPPGGII